MGYNPETNEQIWKREFRHRFGEGPAEEVEYFYRRASRVLPLITAALLPGASEWSWWPEMDTGGNLREYSHIQTGDPGQFAATRSWVKTPDWRWEEWDVIPGSREEESGLEPPSGRVYPEELRHLFPGKTLTFLQQRLDTGEVSSDAEARITATDFCILAGLAQYHCEKLEAARRLVKYESDGYKSDLQESVECLRRARAAWKQIVDASTGVYHANLVFGVSPENARNQFGHHHSGHWKDRLAEIDADLKRLEELEQKAPARELGLTLNRGGGDPGYGELPAKCRHVPPKIRADQASIPFELVTTEGTIDQSIRPIHLYLRPLDQTRKWTRYEMKPVREDKTDAVWRVEVPIREIDRSFDVQYYFNLGLSDFPYRNWPDWREGQPYFVVPVETK
jgi:hypothetical protein